MHAFRRIVVATDFSAIGDEAVRQAFGLVRDANTDLTLLHVLEVPPAPNPLYAHYSAVRHPGPEERDLAIAAATKALQALVPRAARELGVRIAIRVREGAAADQIVAAASEESAEVIVIGNSGHAGLPRLLLGSVTDRVARTAPCSVLIVQGPALAEE
jgi:nucleotide-binding universal stress UspA family protein